VNRQKAVGKKDPADTRTPTERLVEFAENFKGNGIKREEDRSEKAGVKIHLKSKFISK